MIQVRCGMGIGNRVCALANALSRWPEIRFVWRVNEHVPATHMEVFPVGIPGVVFETEAPPAFASKFDGRWCYEWDAAKDRAKAAEAYTRIMSAMAGNAGPQAPRVAVFARFHRNPDATPETLIRAAPEIAAATPEVLLLSDLHRAPIAAALEAAGARVTHPACKELAADLQRPREDFLRYLSDWKTLAACHTIHAQFGPASALHPPRAIGADIRYW